MSITMEQFMQFIFGITIYIGTLSIHHIRENTMTFVDWAWINGVKLGLEVVPPSKKGQSYVVQLDLLIARATFTYYGQRL